MKRFRSCLAAALFSFLLTSVSVRAEAVNIYEQNTMSVLWFQQSAEAKALYYQGYNIGKLRLDEYLKKPKNARLKPAIVLDIDETILDNSPYQAWYVLNGKGRSFEWDRWFQLGKAKALPGAIEFLQYANSKGVDIYYISNRNIQKKESTIQNLQLVGAPQVTSEHVLLREPAEKGKEERRMNVAKTHEIILLFGDNLGDFSGFDGLTVAARTTAVTKQKDEFGKKLIIFPNPMYGDWEQAMYDYQEPKSPEEKAKLRKKYIEIP